MAIKTEDVEGADSGRRQSTVEEQDEGRLAQFGYKQELRRDWGLMHNFGISFSIIVRDIPRAVRRSYAGRRAR